MQTLFTIVLATTLLFYRPGLEAAIIGTNTPASPLTLARIKALPADQQAAWQAYLSRSEFQAQRDQKAFWNETHQSGATNIPVTSPPATRGTRGIPLERSSDWYKSPEARRLADIIVSFQTPSGGWSKNLDMTAHPRANGEFFATGNLNPLATPEDLDTPHDARWNYVGTFDNGATTTQLRFLARIATVLEKSASIRFRTAFSNGLEYIYASQYPNGGWPQVWPLQGGYHDAVTFNDGAMIGILDLLADVAVGEGDFGFITEPQRKKAQASVLLGLDCVLKSQVVVNNKLTVWGQQHDVLTLLPTAARNYEMPSLASGESAGILLFLLRQQNPNARVVKAVESSAAWFKKTAIQNKSYEITINGRDLVDAHGSGPLWSRYYDLRTEEPIFGERDKTIRNTVSEISKERRNGYAWFTDSPKAALAQYTKWKAQR